MTAQLHQDGVIARGGQLCQMLADSHGPVSVTIRTTGDAIRVEEICPGSPNTRLMTPVGTPASMKHWTNAQAVPGVSSAALMITEQPAASAPLILRAGELIGTFQGVKCRHRPDRQSKHHLLHLWSGGN